MKRWLQLSFLVPNGMVVLVLVNFALCFKSPDWLAFRTWEVAVWASKPGGIGPFEPNRVILKEHAYGDLAGMGNMKDMRVYRREEFHVDRFGFRNLQTERPTNSVGLVVGDSFTIGAGVSDSETLPVQLSADAGEFFYNAGGEASFVSAEAAASMLQLSSGTLVYQLLERSARHAPPDLSELKGNPLREPSEAQPLSKNSVTSVLASAIELLVSDHSPGFILSRKFVKNLQDDVWIPNPYSNDVVRRRLRNGDEMLFFPDDFKPVADQVKLASAWRCYLAAFSRRMAERHVTMMVLLVPDKGTVYGSLMDTATSDSGGQDLLAMLEKELRGADVPTLNLTPLFRTAAVRLLPQHDYLYWRDDTHWNAQGVKLAANALWSEIESSQKHNLGREPSFKSGRSRQANDQK